MVDEKILLQMRVDESKQRDVGKRRARIGHNAMDYLHVAPGDIIEIKGTKTSCAIVWPSDEDEKNPDSIRLDGQTRKNIGAAIGDVVFVKKVKVKTAKNVKANLSDIGFCTAPTKLQRSILSWTSSGARKSD